VKVRLEKYHKQTEPVLRFYKDILISIDGEMPISTVNKEIVRKIKALAS
jgi:adenylate kinase family enzyme